MQDSDRIQTQDTGELTSISGILIQTKGNKQGLLIAETGKIQQVTRQLAEHSSHDSDRTQTDRTDNHLYLGK